MAQLRGTSPARQRGGARTIEPYVEIEAKTGGWVAGDVYLDRNLSVRTGLILRLL
jgi:hypothetical protein